VVDETGKLVGIVSRGDLLKVFLRTDRDLRSDIRRLLDSAQIRLGARGIKVRVSGGIVDMAGNFESKTRLEAIVRAIGEIDGVVGVRSKVAFDVDDSVDDSRFPPINIR
jgi:osmotically-inducible protein OsmY